MVVLKQFFNLIYEVNMLKDIIFKNTAKFSIKKPGTNKMLWFRPMLVKEEKKLLILQEMGSKQEIINSISEIIDECFDEINAGSLPTYEFDYYFIHFLYLHKYLFLVCFPLLMQLLVDFEILSLITKQSLQYKDHNQH